VNTNRNLISKAIRFITFTDLPIRKKFVLFAFGVLFWFMMLTAASFFALIDVNVKTTQLVNTLLPYKNLAHETLQHSYEIAHWTTELDKATSEEQLQLTLNHLNRDVDKIKDNLRYINSRTAISPLSQLWNKINNHDWLQLEQNKAYVEDIAASTRELNTILIELSSARIQSIRGINTQTTIHKTTTKFIEMRQHLQQNCTDFLTTIDSQSSNYSNTITTTTKYAFWIIMVVLVFATGLLAIFTFWISASIVKPVNSMIDKIHTLATGNVDLTDKIEICSDDEIGAMSAEFNDLMDTVHGMTVFKHVIEEDSTLEDVYSRMGEAFHTNVGIDTYRIYEVSADFKTMKAAFPISVSENELDCDSDILNSCDLCRAVKTGHEISSITYDRVCKQFKHDQDKCHVCIPMIIGGQAGGVVQLTFDKHGENATPRARIEQQVAKAEAYIKQSLSVIEAKRLMETLRDSTLRDPMTGLLNRRFLQDQASFIIAGANRRKKNVGMLMCDIDYFKQVNDKYGHDAGDQVLIETTKLLSAGVRDTDMVIRFGGEEFLILLVDVEPGDAVNVAEKIRETVAEKTFTVGMEKFNKTISIGVSEFPKDTDAFWQAIKYADVALYQAKDGGRNQVVKFDESMWTEDEF